MKSKHFIFAICLIQNVFVFGQELVSYKSFGKGITFQTKDSTGSVKINARIQNLASFKQNPNEDFDPAVSAMVRRSRLKFSGYALNPKLTYKIELGLSNRDTKYDKDASLVGGTARIILDAVVKYPITKNTHIWFGQTKLPGNRERIISSQQLQFVDRSLLNSEFNIDRDMGVQFHSIYNLGKSILKHSESISLGEGRNVITSNIGGLDYSARIEFLPMGKFSDKGDYFGSDLSREENLKLSIAIAGNYNNNTYRQSGQLGSIMIDTSGNYATSNLTTLFGDLMLKYNGLSVMIESAFKTNDRLNYSDINGKQFKQGIALSGQIGYLLPSNYEFSGRYTVVESLKKVTTKSKVDQYTLGFSKYFIKHSLKIQTDLTFEQINSSTFADQNLIFRVQTELAF